MTRTVWKTSLHSGRGMAQTAELPTPFEVVHVVAIDSLPDRIDVWFLCDPSSGTETVTFRVAPTGAPVPTDQNGAECIYVGTVLFRERVARDPIVFHLFRNPTELEPAWSDK